MVIMASGLPEPNLLQYFITIIIYLKSHFVKQDKALLK